MKKSRSFRLILFFAIFISMIASLALLSTLTTLLVNSKIEKLLDAEVTQKAKSADAIYRTNMDQLLKVTVAGSKKSYLTLLDSNSLNDLVFGNEVDFLFIADPQLVIQANYPSKSTGYDISINGFIENAIKTKIPMSSTELISSDEIEKLGQGKSQDYRVTRVPTVFQPDVLDSSFDNHVLAMVAVAPLLSDGDIEGAVVAVDVLNNDNTITDTIKKTLSTDANMFQKDTTISTTLTTEKGNRFVGTIIPENVQSTVQKGNTYVGREWSLSFWSRTVYLPIKDHKGVPIGSIKLWINEDTFRKSDFWLKNRDITNLILIAMLILIIISATISYFISKYMVRPIDQLVESTRKVCDGNFEHKIEVKSYKEINHLVEYFNTMIDCIRQYVMKKEKDMLIQANKMAKEGKNEK